MSKVSRRRNPGLLFVGNFLPQGIGSFSASEELSSRLKRYGWVIHKTSHYLNPFLRLAHMITTAIGKNGLYEVGHIDVFSGRAFLWADVMAFVFRRLGKPYILTLRGGNLPEFSKRFPIRVKRLLASATRVTTPSDFLGYELKKFRDDVCVLPNSLEISSYPSRLRTAVRPRLVWLRAFHEIYNPTLAPKVLSLLETRLPHVHLTMIGPDKQDGSLEKTRQVAKELGVRERMEIVEGVPKKEVGLRVGRADIFLNTTNIDNTPVSVIEAMACGLCVVTTNVGGIPHLLQTGENALLVPPRDAVAMSDAVTRLLSDETLAGKLSANGIRKAEGFDWDITLPKWDRLLRQVVQAVPGKSGARSATFAE